jgi:hypothetical protein
LGTWWNGLSDGLKTAVVGGIFAIVAAAIGAAITIAGSSQDRAASATTSPPVATGGLESNPSVSIESTTTSSASEESTAAAGTVTRYLAWDSNPADSQEIPWFAGFVNDEGPQEINGTSYQRNLTFNWECSSPHEKYAEYNLGRHYDRFQAVIGPGDTSTQTYHFEIWLDGEREYSATLRHGQSRKIDLPVKDVLTLRVGACGTEPEQMAYRGGVYGDPRVTGKASEVPPPTTG